MAFDFGGVVDAAPVLLLLHGFLLDVVESITGQLQATLLTATEVKHLAGTARYGELMFVYNWKKAEALEITYSARCSTRFTGENKTSTWLRTVY